MDQSYFVYVLRSHATGKRYVGSCQDIGERLRRHNSGTSKSTKHGIPWVLVFQEAFESRRDALQRERFYKTGRGRNILDQLESSRTISNGV